jgi:hypothetical protein
METWEEGSSGRSAPAGSDKTSAAKQATSAAMTLFITASLESSVLAKDRKIGVYVAY